MQQSGTTLCRAWGGNGGEITTCLFSSGQQFIMCGGPQNTMWRMAHERRVPINPCGITAVGGRMPQHCAQRLQRPVRPETRNICDQE
jgi:hypothetical protein